MLVVVEKRMVLRCSLQLAFEMRPSTPWAVQRTDDFLEYVEETEIVEER